MPFGPWSTFNDCVSDIMERSGYDEETASAVCGALEQKMGGTAVPLAITATKGSKQDLRVVSSYFPSSSNKQAAATAAADDDDDNGGGEDELYMKIFLIDSSLNQNHWGVAPDTIERNIKTAIGKPLVLYKNTGLERDRLPGARPIGGFDHPPVNDDSLDHILQSQEPFRVGTFIDVVRDGLGVWWGIVEIEDKGLKKAVREDPNRAFYVSPSIRMTHALQPDSYISDWTFIHTAIVDKPAFGVMKAYVRGQCAGAKDTCLLQLRRASVEVEEGAINSNNKDPNSCGFCTYEAMNQIANNARVSGADKLLMVAQLPPSSADRPDSDFAYVPENAKGPDGSKSLRKFPIYDKAHVRNALARFSQADLPRNKRGEVLDRICRAAKKFEIESEVCAERAETGKIPAPASLSSVDVAEQQQQQQPQLVTNKIIDGPIETRSSSNNNNNNHDNQTLVAQKSPIGSTSLLRKSGTIEASNNMSATVVEQRESTSIQGGTSDRSSNNNTATNNNNPNPTLTTPTTPTTATAPLNNNNNSDTILISKTKLAQLIAAKEANKRKSTQLETKLASTERNLKAMEQINTKSADRLASLERWVLDQKKRERYNHIGAIVASSPVYDGLSNEEKEEQLRTLAASTWTIEEIRKYHDPLNKVATAANEKLQQTVSASNKLPFGGNQPNNHNNNNSRIKSASLNETETSQQQGPKPMPRALQEAMYVIGNKGVEL